MPEDPIGMLMANFANVANTVAPHVVIPKMIASIIPAAPAPGQSPAAAATGGKGLGGVSERQATRTGEGIEVLQQRLASDRANSQKSGYSVTGSTLFM
jgi:hypothetical protein